MAIDLNNKELKIVKTLVNVELGTTKALINDATTGADAKELSDYYDTLYMIKQKLAKE